MELAGTTLTVFTYRPDCYRNGPLILVFHGSDRKPALARDNAVPLALAACAVMAAPLFPAEAFPRWAYQFGGIGDIVEISSRRRFRLRSADDWTGRLVLALIERLRENEQRDELPYYLVGHSAGAQFLARFAAFVPNRARRIVLANPGTHVFPTRERAFPYGFGGLPARLARDEDLRRYLAAPVIILVATLDRRREGLDTSAGADRQGLTRYERGRNAFETARAVAAAGGWAFGWELIEAPGLGHGSGRLYRRREAADALFGPETDVLLRHDRAEGSLRHGAGAP